MFLTSATIAMCWERICEWIYMKENNTAICLSSFDEILPNLQK